MDIATGWSLVRLVKSGGTVLKGANPLGLAIGALALVKKWEDSANAEVLDNVRKREGCSHLIMIEGSPPTPTASQFVAQEGGVAWLVDESSLWFWHKDKAFKPCIYKKALIQGAHGVKIVTPQEHDRAVPQPSTGYGCSDCKQIQKSRDQL